MTNKEKPLHLFATKIISESGGLHDFEEHEMATPIIDRDEATVIWTLRCLANPGCKGSREILDLIADRRKELGERL